MKTFAIVAGLFAAFTTVSAQAGCVSSAMSLVPSCGQSCLLAAKSSIGCTVETDFACACSKSAQLATNSALTACVLSACDNNVATALQVSSGAQSICSCVATAGSGGAGSSAGPTTSAAAPASTPAAGASSPSSAASAPSSPAPSEPAPSGGACAGQVTKTVYTTVTVE